MPDFFAACPKGLESLLTSELKLLGLSGVKETVAGAAFTGSLTDAMRVCLWSRFASRVLMQLTRFGCRSDLDLYLGAYGVPWEDYLSPAETIAVEFTGSSSEIKNTQYGAQKVKDALCDHLVKSSGSRPNVDRRNPQVLIYAHLGKGEAEVGIDLSGKALFWREFERETGSAPLKENLAAAMLARTGYQGGNFLDPMCGSGTLLLEAALILTDTAPGLKRRHYGFFKLKNFDKEAWQGLITEAKERAAAGLQKALDAGVTLCGLDADARMIELAKENAARAGFGDLVKLECVSIEKLDRNPLPHAELPLTIVTNPPYGERMGNFNELILLYAALGAKLKALFHGARLGVISSSEDLLSCLRLKHAKSYTLYNGALSCQLRVYSLERPADAGEEKLAPSESLAEIGAPELPAPDFINRVKKNLTKLKPWAEREGLNSYRIYDADIPEYNAAVDLYDNYAVLQEYQAPASISAGLARRRLLDMIAALQLGLNLKGEHLIVKSRQRQQGKEQYEKNEDSAHVEVIVREGELRFKAKLDDYLDSGIFFDARPIRQLIAKEAAGKDFLNLFAYTAAASVSAAKGGAASTLSVDMSRTYLEWGMENFALNGLEITDKHEFLQADCLAYLSADSSRRFDLIYIDPPTFSNSKRMSRSFEVQRDHVPLLANLTRHLKDGGTVIFCCNRRGFKLNAEALAAYGFEAEDLTKATTALDFARDAGHSCFRLTFTEAAKTAEPEPMVEIKGPPRWSKLLSAKPAHRGREDYGERRGHAAGEQSRVWGQAQPRRPGSAAGGFDRERRGFNEDRRGYAEDRRDFQQDQRGFNKDRHGFNQERHSFNQERRGFKGEERRPFSAHGSRERFGKPGRGRPEPPRKVRVWGPDGVRDDL